MPERSEALKKAQQKYMEKFSIARIRMEREQYERLQAHAAAVGESVNAYVNEAIIQRIERDHDLAIAERVAKEHGKTVDEILEDAEFARALDRYPDIKAFVFNRNTISTPDQKS